MESRVEIEREKRKVVFRAQIVEAVRRLTESADFEDVNLVKSFYNSYMYRLCIETSYEWQKEKYGRSLTTAIRDALANPWIDNPTIHRRETERVDLIMPDAFGNHLYEAALAMDDGDLIAGCGNLDNRGYNITKIDEVSMFLKSALNTYCDTDELGLDDGPW